MNAAAVDGIDAIANIFQGLRRPASLPARPAAAAMLPPRSTRLLSPVVALGLDAGVFYRPSCAS